MKQADKNFLDDVYDTLMKNTQYRVRDFTKYKDVWIDVEQGFIKIGKRKLILIKEGQAMEILIIGISLLTLTIGLVWFYYGCGLDN